MVSGYLQVDSLKAVVARQCDVELDVSVHHSIDSTNSWCLQQSRLGRLLPFACFAEEQTSGRGRRGKQWFMSPRSNIAMSLAWPFSLSYPPLHLLPLSIALAITETLESLGMKHVQIKWPNDVYVQGKKIAGVLIETQPVKSEQVNNYVVEGRAVAAVIGLGLNFDMRKCRQAKNDESLVFTDICEQVQSQGIEMEPERNVVASSLLCNVVSACQSFDQVPEEGLKKFRASYDYCRHKAVKVTQDNGEILIGEARGVNDSAELLVLIDGELRAFNSAEVSVRAGKVAGG